MMRPTSCREGRDTRHAVLAWSRLPCEHPFLIRIDSVTKHYGASRVLGPVSLDVAPHSTLALVGSSGSGKSTLLRMLVGLVVPDAGRVEVAGEQVTTASVERLRLRIGYVIQDGGLFPHLSAGENASIVARHLGWDSARVASRVAELAALVRLRDEVLRRHPAQLSGGERQRVSLMRALFLDPDVLLLDEPLGALDAVVRAELHEELRAIFRKLSKTVLLVTHDIREAAFLADEIAVMRDGVIVRRGTLDELTRNPGDPFVERLLAAQRS
jgi:osmoprotectant transport system ATP-binding protein